VVATREIGGGRPDGVCARTLLAATGTLFLLQPIARATDLKKTGADSRAGALLAR